jgi:hypothetical protein
MKACFSHVAAANKLSDCPLVLLADMQDLLGER